MPKKINMRTEGTLQKRKRSILRTRVREDPGRTASSGHDGTSALMSSQPLRLPVQDLPKINPVSIPTWTGLTSELLLTADSC